MKNKRITCSSKVALKTVEKLDDLHNWTGMTKGELVDLAITNLHTTKKADKSLMIYIKKEEDRAFILDTVQEQYANAYEKVLKDIEKYYH
ncbi:MAG: hypothetical protein COA44_15115 [Arcobacter sp.]|nr:MAG: hypothetical protein COA44_15115 [Arcobacter sp.]